VISPSFNRISGPKRCRTAGGLGLAALLVLPAIAAAEGDGFTLELNRVETVSTGCRITLVAHNGLPEALSQMGLELVVFDRDGGVAGYAAIDFADMPRGKTRVRQYDIFPGACETVERILVNDVRSCKSAAGRDLACADSLRPSSRVEIDLTY